MSEPARNRFALDLEDLERQLRGASQAPRPGQASDPLAELTRIVGQDDPLKGLFGARGQVAAAPPAMPSPPQARQEPTFAAPVRSEDAAPPAEMRGALDEFEALLRRTDGARAPAVAEPAYADEPADSYDDELPEPQAYVPQAAAQHDYADAPRDLDNHAHAYSQAQYGPEPAEAFEEDLQDLEPRRSRKGLWAAAAVLVVGVVGVGAAMSIRSAAPSKDGQPPTIAADRGPTKVEPANPGGTEVPNQNKQIYERAGQVPAVQSKVVSREEQPVDVQQAARSMPARVVLAGPGAVMSDAGNGNPLAQAPVTPERSATPADSGLTAVPPVPGLGEPRRVRTVSIRPDGTPAPAANANAAYSNSSLPLSTGSAPARPSGVAVGNPSASATGPAARPKPAPAAETPKAQERIATPSPATTPSAPFRIASAGPAATTPVPPAPATAAIRSGSGDFTVQLGAPGSESEARATFSALQRKYPEQLGGQSPIVRKTELAGGKTVYRLRVGPYSQGDAASMCTQLQSVGGQCFVAKN